MFITTRRAGRFIRSACPGWLVVIWIVCGFVPTPFELDELLPAVLTLAVLALQPQRFPRACSAWRGGKSHRLHEVEA